MPEILMEAARGGLGRKVLSLCRKASAGASNPEVSPASLEPTPLPEACLTFLGALKRGCVNVLSHRYLFVPIRELTGRDQGSRSRVSLADDSSDLTNALLTHVFLQWPEHGCGAEGGALWS